MTTSNLKASINVSHIKLNQFTTIDLIGYLGAAFMVAFSFTLNTPTAILGLILLTIQAYKVNLSNLVILNLISIIGFSLNYFI